MTKENTKKCIEIMQGFVNGKTVQQKNAKREWKCLFSPHWNWADDTVEYRLKPEPYYRPFESAEEAMEAIKEHGSYVKHKMESTYYLITQVKYNGVVLKNDTCTTYYDIMEGNFIFSDGTPFGKLVDEA